ncbi:MAG: DUF1127 domain-containing protein [Rhizobiales bacterium]|nr:DUF1127 domain-containing protein [Hyphomicrobiales bacterium]
MTNLIADLWNSIARWRQRRETIIALSGLSDHALKDIGIDRSEIYSVATEVAGQRHPVRVRTAPVAAPATGNTATANSKPVDDEWLEAA